MQANNEREVKEWVSCIDKLRKSFQDRESNADLFHPDSEDSTFSKESTVQITSSYFPFPFPFSFYLPPCLSSLLHALFSPVPRFPF